jgi:hypothetical protein
MGSAFKATGQLVRLLKEIRAVQHVVAIADCPVLGDTAKPALPILEQFLSRLPTAWKEVEVRFTSIAKAKPERSRRRPDPSASVTNGCGDGLRRSHGIPRASYWRAIIKSSDALVEVVAQRVGEIERDLPGLLTREPEAAD